MMGSSQNNWPHIINVSNSIIGITILAMPFCFQMCGIILGFLLLMLSTWMTLVSCHLLMKAGVTTRRRSYSFLAYYTHGAIGKMFVEVGMIGLQLGTLVAQIVIIGDLGPAIVSKFTGLSNTEDLRTGLIVCLCLFVGLPLGLLKDVRALSKTSTLCIIFYSFFAVYVFTLSLPKIWAGGWYNKINLWRMDGLFQCLPIFSFAFGCQTQLFIVYDCLTEPSLKRINSIVSSAVNMCTVSYLLVGFFGYITFSNIDEISGDIVNHFTENLISDGIKLCFVFSIAVSIPLIVFPCRMSLYTLLFPQKPKEDLPVSGKIPEFHFKVITICIIVGSMVIGILVPNVEFVLGISGATLGSLMFFVFPALFYLNVVSDAGDGKWSARLLLVFGLTILICSTYVTITNENLDHRPVPMDVDVADQLAATPDITKLEEKNKAFVEGNVPDGGVGGEDDNGSKRREPPNPKAPGSPDEQKKIKADVVEQNDEVDKGGTKDDNQPNSNIVQDEKRDANHLSNKRSKDVDKLQSGNQQKDDKIGKVKDMAEGKEGKDAEKKEAGKDEAGKDEAGKDGTGMDGAGKDGAGKDGVAKADLEALLQEEKAQLAESGRKQEVILGKLEQQQEQQQKLLEEQKQILVELKHHQDGHKEDAKDIDQQMNLPQQVQNLQDAGQVGQQQQVPAQGQVDQVQGQAFQQPAQVQGVQQQVQGLQQPIQGQGLQQPGQGLQQPVQGQGLQQPVQGQGLQQPLQVQDFQQGQGLQQPVQGQGLQPVQGQQLPIQGQVLQPVDVQQQIVNNPVQVLADQNPPLQQIQDNFAQQGVAVQGQNNPQEIIQQVNVAAGNQQVMQAAGAQQDVNNMAAGNQDAKIKKVLADPMVRHKRDETGGEKEDFLENIEVEGNVGDNKNNKQINEHENIANNPVKQEDVNNAIQRDLKEYNHISNVQIKETDAGNEVKFVDYVDNALKDLKESIYKDNNKDNPLVYEMGEGHKGR